MIDVHVGRTGPDEFGERLIASVWASRIAMIKSMGEDVEASRFHPEYLPETTDRWLDVRPLEIAVRFAANDEAGIMRLARGTVRHGELSAYVEEVRLGVRRTLRGVLARLLSSGPRATGHLHVPIDLEWTVGHQDNDRGRCASTGLVAGRSASSDVRRDPTPRSSGGSFALISACGRLVVT